MAKPVKDILLEVYDDYKGLVELLTVWEKRRGRYYIEVDIKGVDYFTALSIVEDLKMRLSSNGIWFKQLGPIKYVVKQSGGKVWRFCARARDFNAS